MVSSAEEYLNKNVRHIIEALAEAVVTEEPKNPVSYY